MVDTTAIIKAPLIAAPLRITRTMKSTRLQHRQGPIASDDLSPPLAQDHPEASEQQRHSDVLSPGGGKMEALMNGKLVGNSRERKRKQKKYEFT